MSRRQLTSGPRRNNIYCTVAIIIRLWRRHNSIAHASQDSQIWRALRIFVESASLLT